MRDSQSTKASIVYVSRTLEHLSRNWNRNKIDLIYNDRFVVCRRRSVVDGCPAMNSIAFKSECQ